MSDDRTATEPWHTRAEMNAARAEIEELRAALTDVLCAFVPEQESERGRRIVARARAALDPQETP